MLVLILFLGGSYTSDLSFIFRLDLFHAPCSDNSTIVGIICDGDCSKMTIDQLRALEKLLPDSGTVEMVKGYNGDIKLLGTAEDFFLKLVKVKQLSCLLCAPVFVVCASVCCV